MLTTQEQRDFLWRVVENPNTTSEAKRICEALLLVLESNYKTIEDLRRQAVAFKAICDRTVIIDRVFKLDGQHGARRELEWIAYNELGNIGYRSDDLLTAIETALAALPANEKKE